MNDVEIEIVETGAKPNHHRHRGAGSNFTWSRKTDVRAASRHAAAQNADDNRDNRSRSRH